MLATLLFLITALSLAKSSIEGNFCVHKFRGGRMVSEGNCEDPKKNPVILDLERKLKAREWAGWSPWSVCSKTCGTGRRTKTRSCGDVVRGCKGNSAGEETCNTKACPVWTQWDQWSACSRTCATGEQTRTRTCNNGPGCIGERVETVQCYTRACPAWTIWGQWSSCSRTCENGQRTRTRSCSNSPGCVGNSAETGTCYDRHCPVWATWGSWSTCSASCGSGSHSRSRTCNYGPGCGGSSTDSGTCYIKACPICYYNRDGSDYRGYVSHTNSGRTCQYWTDQSPHKHSRTPSEYPSAGLGYHNYCRNPDGEDHGPWCYTTDSDSRWEYCPAPKC